eukprot:scaffold2167_cov51-Attheya_sp.AAC.1
MGVVLRSGSDGVDGQVQMFHTNVIENTGAGVEHRSVDCNTIAVDHGNVAAEDQRLRVFCPRSIAARAAEINRCQPRHRAAMIYNDVVAH